MLYTVTEVAKMLKVNRNFVYKLIKDGELEAVRIIWKCKSYERYGYRSS